MKKRYFVISDIEMGKGDVMDDFTDDQHLIEFIRHIVPQEDTKTFLVLNGDIFDFLKMDYQGGYPRYITEEISLWKLEQIYKTHYQVFQAFAEFIRHENCFIHFVIGNHDFDLSWPRLQERIRLLLNGNESVNFSFLFQDEGLHIEHGHSLDPFFQHDPDEPFEFFRGQNILNMPIGCHIVFDYIAPFKRQYPQEDQFYPRTEVVERYPEYNRAIRRMKWLSIWNVAYKRLRYFNDPTYHLNARAFIKHVLEFGFDFIDDARFLPLRLKMLHKIHPHKQLFVLGHTHIFSEIEYKDKRFLITDTWRDEFSILVKGRPKKKKTYAEIHSENNFFQKAEIKFFIPESEREHRNVPKAQFSGEEIGFSFKTNGVRMEEVMDE